MHFDNAAPGLSETELDELIAEWALELSPTERQHVLTMARSLQRAVALVKSYNTEAEGAAS